MPAAISLAQQTTWGGRISMSRWM